MPYRYLVHAPREFVWDRLMHLETFYADISPAHRFFRVQGGGPLTAHAMIDCCEVVEGQSLTHSYVMAEFIPGQSVHYVSRGSVTELPDGRRFQSTVHCHYQLSDAASPGEQDTWIDFAVVIVLPTAIHKIIARLLGTATVWKPHVVEESLGLARRLDREWAAQAARGSPDQAALTATEIVDASLHSSDGPRHVKNTYLALSSWWW